MGGGAAVHAGLCFRCCMSGRIDLMDPQGVLRVVRPQRPGRRHRLRRRRRPRRSKRKPKETEGGAPENIRSQATPVVAPKPLIELPGPPDRGDRNAAPGNRPQPRAQPTCAGRDGRGRIGTGTGSGAGGSGSGGGGGGGAAAPRLVTPVLTARNFPRQMLAAWPRGAQVFMRLRVDAQGVVQQCIVDRGTGMRPSTAEVCANMQRGSLPPGAPTRTAGCRMVRIRQRPPAMM